MKFSAVDEQSLMKDLWTPEIADNPENFALYVYPWGHKGTPLEQHKGPRGWQREVFQEITRFIATGQFNQANDLPTDVFREAVASGRGPGKSTLFAMLAHWFQSTRLGGTVIVTANTEAQLRSRTMAEFSKWFTLALNSHWFLVETLRVTPQSWFMARVKDQLKIDPGYYYVQAQTWSEEKPDAFAGAHNPRGMMVLFDEAAGIPRPIWTVTQGFFTEPIVDRYWLAFSNPRKNSGPFFDCFHDNKPFWRTRQIDSRTVEGTDAAYLDSVIAQEGGIDTDGARVEVLGQFPQQGDNQFISSTVVREAQQRELVHDPFEPLILGVDPAPRGRTALRFRQGRDARTIPPVILQRTKDTNEIVDAVVAAIQQYNPDAICCDQGNGTGVIDALRARKIKVFAVDFGGASHSSQWAHRGTELWATIRDWLPGAMIDSSPQLYRDLTVREFRQLEHGREGVIILETKKELASRGIPSPDDADALACTFAVRMPRRDRLAVNRGGERGTAEGVEEHYGA